MQHSALHFLMGPQFIVGLSLLVHTLDPICMNAVQCLCVLLVQVSIDESLRLRSNQSGIGLSKLAKNDV